MAGEDFGINTVYQKRLFVHTYVHMVPKGPAGFGTSCGKWSAAVGTGVSLSHLPADVRAGSTV
jgi:hypothetical protein